jgi:hypothetical protein
MITDSLALAPFGVMESRTGVGICSVTDDEAVPVALVRPAVTVSVEFVPGVVGAVYRPVASTLPSCALHTITGFETPVTTAVNCFVWLNATEAVAGLIEIAKIFTVTLAFLLWSSTLVAVIVTGFVGGSAAGAV